MPTSLTQWVTSPPLSICSLSLTSFGSIKVNVVTFFYGVSQFERDIIQVHTNEGLQAARARGRKGGRPKVNQKNIDLALNLYDSKSCSIADILKTTGISKATLYSYLKRR